MNYLDIAIIISFFTLTFLIGFTAKQKANTESDYFLGGRNLPWWALSISLVATETSTLTFLGIPALSYIGDYSFLSLVIGLVIGRSISAIFIIPKFMNGNYLSIYQWVGIKFGNESQITLSGLFSVIRILSDGVRLYAASIPLAYLLAIYFPNGYSFQTLSIISLVLLSIATILYSAYGGFRAVVWTDLLQFIVYLLGGILVLILLWQEFGSLLSLFNDHPNRLMVFHKQALSADGNLDPYFYIFSIPGGILLALGSHGTDQMLVQRLLACKNLKESQLAMVGSGVIVFIQFLIFLMIGSYLYFALPNTNQPNRVFSEFIVSKLSSPLKGLILAGVFASSMSTLSSTLNSLTLTTQVDMKLKFQSKYSPVWITILWGLALLTSSLIPFFIDEKTQASIVELGLTFASYAFGPMVALFFLEIFPFPTRKKFNRFFFPIILIASIVLTFSIKKYFSIPFTWIVGLGILLFYFNYYLSIITSKLFRKI